WTIVLRNETTTTKADGQSPGEVLAFKGRGKSIGRPGRAGPLVARGRDIRRNRTHGAAGAVHRLFDAHEHLGAALGQHRRPRRRRFFAAFLFRLGDLLLPRRGHGDAGQLLNLDALMGIFHDAVPRHRRQRAAGHAIGRGVVVVAHPDAANEVTGVTHEPGVAVSIGGSGLAGGNDAVKARTAAGAV